MSVPYAFVGGGEAYGTTGTCLSSFVRKINRNSSQSNLCLSHKNLHKNSSHTSKIDSSVC